MIGQSAGGGVAVRNAELAAGPITIGVDRGLRHPELAGDLLGTQMAIDQAQAFALPWGQKLDRVRDAVTRCAHRTNTLATRVSWRLLVMLSQSSLVEEYRKRMMGTKCL